MSCFLQEPESRLANPRTRASENVRKNVEACRLRSPTLHPCGRVKSITNRRAIADRSQNSQVPAPDPLPPAKGPTGVGAVGPRLPILETRASSHRRQTSRRPSLKPLAWSTQSLGQPAPDALARCAQVGGSKIRALLSAGLVILRVSRFSCCRRYRCAHSISWSSECPSQSAPSPTFSTRTDLPKTRFWHTDSHLSILAPPSTTLLVNPNHLKPLRSLRMLLKTQLSFR